MLTVGSLFAGIGGFDLGFERAGMRTVWFCEQDPYCQKVLAKHWPGVECYPDVRAIVGNSDCSSSDAHASQGSPRATTREPGGGDDVPVRVPPVDVLCGGFPCQDLSYAGRGAGIDGARSGLWSEYARLVGELRPRYVVVENVSALLARGLERVLGDLATLGYDAEWDCIPASAVGAPHQRDRVWIVAYPQCSGLEGPSGQSRGAPQEVARVGDARRGGDVADSTDERCERGRPSWAGRLGSADSGERGRARTVADPASYRREAEGERPAAGHIDGASELRQGPEAHWLVEPDVGRVADGVPARLDRLRSLGNALVPQIAEWIGHRIVSYEREKEAAAC